MRRDARILVIGPAALGGTVQRALPRCRSVTTDALLSGLWSAGHEEYDGVVVSLTTGGQALRAIRNLRDVSPRARIVVTCSAADEPRAREALRAGADDYVLEPVLAEDLEQSLALRPARKVAWDGEAVRAPSIDEITRLSEILQNLGEGLAASLLRVAKLLQAVFDAEGVTVQFDEQSATAGTAASPVLQEPLRQQERIVGGLALGRRVQGTYSTRDAGRLAEYARLIETILSQATEQARWQELAWRDDLSGLRNRRYFDATLDELLARAADERLRVTVVLFDIDDFKTYNDKYGHDTGDALIREVAVLLTRCSRERDVVARYGGDEFAVILWDAEQLRVPGSQHPSDALVVAERFGSIIRAHDFKCLGPDAPGPVTISGGLACFPWDGKTRADIMRAADLALLEAKRNGKGHIRLAAQGEGEEIEGVRDREIERGGSEGLRI